MTHGGTSFGHWAGANSPGFAPDVTSYDYDAPINEYGLPTDKFYKLRKVMQKYSDGKLPAVPKPAAAQITVPEFTLTEYAPLACGIKNTTTSRNPLSFEELNMGWGTTIYTTTLPEVGTNSVLYLDGAHDFAQVFVDGKYIGKTDRVRNEMTVALPPIKKGSRMTIVVEGMGRINFGRAIKDFKGITDDVVLRATVDGDEVTWNLKDWTMHTVPDGYADALKAFENKGHNAPEDVAISSKAGYYRGFFNIKRIGDTFINMETWGKGQVYVNGHAIGRFWRIGPQQTLYVPGCWLKKGKNEIIVLDVLGPKEATVWGQDKPELDKLQLEKTNLHNNPGDRPDLNSATPVATGEFSAERKWQSVAFGSAAKGRFIAIQCLGSQDGGDVVSMAELYAKDAEGKRIDRNSWAVKYADSEDANGGNHTGDKAFDLQESTFWSTVIGAKVPHLLVIDMGKVQTLSGMEYLPCTTETSISGIKGYKIFVY